MTEPQRENCPKCLAERGRKILLEAEETESGVIWRCPVCGKLFSEDDLEEIYGK